jgi:hypothetical protein
LSVVPQRLLPRGSSLVNGTRQVIQAIAVAVLATVLASTLSPEVRQIQAQAEAHAAAAPHVGVCESLPMARASSTHALAANDSDALRQQTCDESVAGFERAYQLTFYATILALALGALLPGWPFAFAGRRAADAPVASGH